MKKKFLILSAAIITSIFFFGCSAKFGNVVINNFTLTIKKPNTYYYTNLIAKLLIKDSNIEAKVLDTNFYKEKELSKDDLDTIKNFTKGLKSYNFIDKPKNLPEKPVYKLFLNFDKEKYVINVYNEKYLTIYPWDGSFPMDYIDMTGTQNLYNLFGLCQYLIPRQ
ncbi:DUF4883 family protein [Candidatus Clostridium stratigraminis]|uniref:DUF4883 family protein n=1 Tax=Candidatus Clostridium stratigraminis TaxID=3381661 RepID=A0ABW8T9X6_9CLOT